MASGKKQSLPVPGLQAAWTSFVGFRILAVESALRKEELQGRLEKAIGEAVKAGKPRMTAPCKTYWDNGKENGSYHRFRV